MADMITLGEIVGIGRRWHYGKHSYGTYDDADAVLFSLRTAALDGRVTVDDIEQLQIYPCMEGGDRHWHIGHWRRDGAPRERTHGQTQERKTACR
jgi:hypothetical protein